MFIIQLYLHPGLNYIFIIKNLKFYKMLLIIKNLLKKQKNAR